MDLIPTKMTAGETLEIPVVVTLFPAPHYTLTLILRGPQAIDLTAVAEDNGHLFTASAPVTSAWAPGAYWWSLRASIGQEVHGIDEGQLTIAPDMAQIAGPHDGRSHAERVLAAIEAVIEGRATKDQMGYAINNRSLQLTPIADLLMLRNKYRAEVRREQQARRGSGTFGRQVQARFG